STSLSARRVATLIRRRKFRCWLRKSFALSGLPVLLNGRTALDGKDGWGLYSEHWRTVQYECTNTFFEGALRVADHAQVGNAGKCRTANHIQMTAICIRFLACCWLEVFMPAEG